ncbi:type I-C CRISPR-associated protein Cas7/Csd2 [Megasphaera stantonii]|uniref:type I-C CRISPR-associated protein Cas7/Csd2 n=1 Tax=Megasphaera stantonii TaxID=2144175 RepID=UPI001D41080A|nr:type I-C CRISPR-associated protein Cas7/Csd2 [Megasphaera stantonii]HJE83383.1 type I-C CRISPR-associated protein Cas7/Csd2 [Megasphaera stantonii]
MNSLTKKIDFVLFVSVRQANPNGDPLLGNMPRTDYEGYGEISDVCIKRKIRNRLQDMGHEIFVQANDRIDDTYASLEDRFKAYFTTKQSDEEVAAAACQRWIDVRSFGQVMTFQKRALGIRGPVSVSLGKSLSPVDVITMQITRSTNGMASESGKRSADTMGTKHFVDFGVYKITGSMNCYFAQRTGFSDEDAQLIRQALLSLFENDMSSARPEGSMAVEKLYWFVHPNALGIASSAKIHQLVQAQAPADDKVHDFSDYVVSVDEERLNLYRQKGLKLEIEDGI